MSRPRLALLALCFSAWAPFAVAQQTDVGNTGSDKHETQPKQQSLMLHADHDHDGLDDALEILLGTDPLDADTDGDTLTDLEEQLIGTDPFTVDNPASQGPEASMYIGMYVLDDIAVIQLSVLYTTNVSWKDFYYANSTAYGTLRRLPPRVLRPLVEGVRNQNSASLPGYRVQTVSLALSQVEFESHASSSFAVTAFADSSLIGETASLFFFQNHLSRVDAFSQMSLMGSKSQGPIGGTGGVFPVDPTPPPPEPEREDDSLCVQTLEPSLILPSGLIYYQVASAECVPNSRTICIPGCVDTQGDWVTGIDIIGLIGQG